MTKRFLVDTTPWQFTKGERIIESFDTLEEAKRFSYDYYNGDAHVIDTETGERVY